MSSPQQQIADIVEALEDDIVLGRLRPHQELMEDALMRRFDVKRHVARAAIQDLVAKGLVVKLKNKSARVKDYAIEEVNWIYDVRMMLCAHAIDTMKLPGSPELVEELKATHEQHTQAVAEHRFRDIRKLNDQFHDQVFRACGNPYLIADIERYDRLSDPIRSTGIVDQAWLKQSLKEHAAIIQAIKKGDREKLRKLVTHHMLPVRDAWLKTNFPFKFAG